ncbi:MAG TPA: DUF983 domain-containing protein [Candidatus Methylomirabilis sp.]
MNLRAAGQAVGRGVRLRCPRCGRGPLFRGPFKMLHNCPECHLRYEREQGYFVGAIYLNYAATVLVALAGYFLLDAYAGLALGPQVALWGTFCALFPLWSFRYSKGLWLALDHYVDPEEDRKDGEQ